MDIRLEIIALIFSGVAIAISLLTFYFSQLRKGKVKLSKPNQIWFGLPDLSKKRRGHILIKSVLYSTGSQGQIIERLYAKLDTNNSSKEFSGWVIGKQSDTYKPGGMKISKEGYVGDHHFIHPKDGTSYSFKTGDYLLRIFAKIAGKETDVLLQKINLEIPVNFSKNLSTAKGVYFNFHSSNGNYVAELDE